MISKIMKRFTRNSSNIVLDYKNFCADVVYLLESGYGVQEIEGDLIALANDNGFNYAELAEAANVAWRIYRAKMALSRVAA